MFREDIGIDLGTTNTLIYVKKKGIVLNEPSVIVLDKNDNHVIAVGKEAMEMYGRTPEDLIAIKPLKDGVIVDIEATQLMITEFLKRVTPSLKILRPKILICCPSNITAIEKLTIKDVVEGAGAGKVTIKEEPLAAAIGVGMNISLPRANMIIDLGGGTTDIAILSLNGIVFTKSVKIAGNYFSEEISNFLKSIKKISTGEETIENLKTNFINVYSPSSNKVIEIKGKDLITGLPTSIKITQVELQEALLPSINKIVSTVKEVLETSPPELSADIVEKGIVITGGSAQLCGLLDFLEQELKVPVFIATSPLTSVIEGIIKLLEDGKTAEEDQ